MAQVHIAERLGLPAGQNFPNDGCVQWNFEGRAFACQNSFYYDRATETLRVKNISADNILAGGTDIDVVLVNSLQVSGANLISTAASSTTPAVTWVVSSSQIPNPVILSLSAASATLAGYVTAEDQDLGGLKTFTHGMKTGAGVLYFKPQAELPACTESNPWVGLGEADSGGLSACQDGILGPLAPPQGLGAVCGVECNHFTANDTSRALKVGIETAYMQTYTNPARGPETSPVINGTRVTAAQVIRHSSNWTWRFYDGTICAEMDWATGTLDFAALKSCGDISGIQHLDFNSQDAHPACTAGNFRIYPDTSEAKLKKCENGTVTDLDTDTVGGGSTETFELYWACSNHTTDNTQFMLAPSTQACAASETAQPSTKYPMNFAGTLTSILCMSSAAVGAGTTMTWTARLNSATNTNIECAMTGTGAGGTECTDTGSQAFVATDHITLRNNETGTDNTTAINFQCVLRGTKT